MPHARLTFPVALALALASGAGGQTRDDHLVWTPDPRLVFALAPSAPAAAFAPAPAPSARDFAVEGRRSRRHAVTSVLAGAMVGTLIGMIDSGRSNVGCAVPDAAGGECPPPESEDRPIIIGAAIGAAVGLLYHLARSEFADDAERRTSVW
jgi:hypothetical protein